MYIIKIKYPPNTDTFFRFFLVKPHLLKKVDRLKNIFLKNRSPFFIGLNSSNVQFIEKYNLVNKMRNYIFYVYGVPRSYFKHLSSIKRTGSLKSFSSIRSLKVLLTSFRDFITKSQIFACKIIFICVIFLFNCISKLSLRQNYSQVKIMHIMSCQDK